MVIVPLSNQEQQIHVELSTQPETQIECIYIYKLLFLPILLEGAIHSGYFSLHIPASFLHLFLSISGDEGDNFYVIDQGEVDVSELSTGPQQNTDI